MRDRMQVRVNASWSPSRSSTLQPYSYCRLKRTACKWAKSSLHSLELNLFLPFFLSLGIVLALSDPARGPGIPPPRYQRDWIASLSCFFKIFFTLEHVSLLLGFHLNFNYSIHFNNLRVTHPSANSGTS